MENKTVEEEEIRIERDYSQGLVPATFLRDFPEKLEGKVKIIWLKISNKLFFKAKLKRKGDQTAI